MAHCILSAFVETLRREGTFEGLVNRLDLLQFAIGFSLLPCYLSLDYLQFMPFPAFAQSAQCSRDMLKKDTRLFLDGLSDIGQFSGLDTDYELIAVEGRYELVFLQVLL
jgi:hypothetical protein